MFTSILARSRIPEATNYDGTGDAISPKVIGISDGKEGTVSFWTNISTVQNFFILEASEDFVCKYENNKFRVEANNSDVSPVRILNLVSNSTYSSGSWIHVIASWNLATPVAHLYISDADDEAAGSTETNDDIDYTPTSPTTWHIARDLDGCLSELWFNDEYLDISNTTNRRKFITAGGKPADLGADGTTPTGNRPLIYAPSGNPVYNRGDGGAFQQQSSVTDCASSPHD